jgi:competence protein ComEA
LRAAPGISAAGRVNLNTATQAELEALSGIGPELARRIIAGRLYRSVEDLDRVQGFGPATLAKIRPLVTVR